MSHHHFLLAVTAVCALLVNIGSTSAEVIFTIADTDDISLSHSTDDFISSPPQPGSTDLGNGVFTWGDLATDTSGNTAVFASGSFTSTDWGGYGTFGSDVIDVSSFDTVDISGMYSGFFRQSSDFTNFFYILDGNKVTFGLGVEDATATNVPVGVASLDVSGATDLVVGFEFSMNNGDVYFDVPSLVVTGTPIPDPASFALLGLGALCIAARRRYKP